jgi:alcohol dehydrogenase (cytochrome c)
MWITGSYDVATNQILWGTGNPIPWSDPFYRPGDNLFTNSLISWDPDSGKMNWYHQYTPGDMWDYDEEGSHVLIDTEGHKLVTHAARNGFLYSFERANGQTLMAKPYVPVVSWTEGIDQKTGLPVDYDPKRDIQVYSGKQNQTPADPTKKLCPSMAGGNNYWPPAYSPKTRLLYIPSWSVCSEVTLDQESISKGIFFSQKFRSSERNESEMVATDPTTGEIKKKAHVAYPNVSGTLATAGGLVFTGLTDGSFIAYDDTTLEQVWKINVGSGFNAPPMSFAVGGKQYVAILSGISAITKTKHVLTPELREMRNQTMLFVFGL